MLRVYSGHLYSPWVRERNGLEYLSRQKTGKKGEDIAAWHLQKLGYHILERNYRSPLGEIDIVARDGETMVFIEVKSRKSEEFGEPELAVGKKKQRKITQISLYYLEHSDDPQANVRYDVVAVKFMSDNTEVRVIRDAFDASDYYF